MSLRARGPERAIQEQADYVAQAVQRQIDAGEQPPYVAYARIKGLPPELTAHKVGQATLGRLGDGYLLDAEVAEGESDLVRDGAIIRILPAEAKE